MLISKYCRRLCLNEPRLKLTFISKYYFSTPINLIDSLDISEGTKKFSPKEVNLENIQASLAKVNNFSKQRQNEKYPTVLIFEINNKGVGSYKDMSLRDLLHDVNAEAQVLDLNVTIPKGSVDAFKLAFDTLPTVHGIERPKIDPYPVHMTNNSIDNLYNATSINHPHAVNAPTFNHNDTHQHHVPDPNHSHSQNINNANKPSQNTYHAGSVLSLRDLHRLDYLFNLNEEKSVLVRRHAVLFAMDPLRAIVMSNRLLLLAPEKGDPLINLIDQFMKEWAYNNEKFLASTCSVEDSHDSASHFFDDVHDTISVSSTLYRPDAHADSTLAFGFELHAYEALLTVVKSLEFQEYDRMKAEVKDVMDLFKSGSSLLPIETQEKMRTLKNELSKMTSRVGSSQRVLQCITEDNEEMALMNLTMLKNKPELYSFPLSAEILSTHDNTQELLESYLIDFNSLSSKLTYLRSQIQSAEELVSLRLDTSRNELLIANTALGVVSISVGIGAYFTGLFGMNLDNAVTYANYNGGFIAVACATGVMIPTLCYGMYMYMQIKNIIPSRVSRPQQENPDFTPRHKLDEAKAKKSLLPQTNHHIHPAVSVLVNDDVTGHMRVKSV